MRGVGDRALARTIDRTAAVLLGAAVALSVWMIGTAVAPWFRWAAAVVAGAAAWLAASAALRRLAGEPTLRLRDFELADFDVFEASVGEPDAAAVDAPECEDIADRSGEADELLLVDVLDAIDSDARVVRLFDREAMPTAGELQARIDQHLTASEREIPDSTHELYAALTALRHSLR